MDVEKAIFFPFWLFIREFEAFTIQNLQIKLDIQNPWPKITLEIKFQPIFLKTDDSIFFLRRRPTFFTILKTSIRRF